MEKVNTKVINSVKCDRNTVSAFKKLFDINQNLDDTWSWENGTTVSKFQLLSGNLSDSVQKAVEHRHGIKARELAKLKLLFDISFLVQDFNDEISFSFNCDKKTFLSVTRQMAEVITFEDIEEGVTTFAKDIAIKVLNETKRLQKTFKGDFEDMVEEAVLENVQDEFKRLAKQREEDRLKENKIAKLKKQLKELEA